MVGAEVLCRNVGRSMSKAGSGGSSGETDVVEVDSGEASSAGSSWAGGFSSASEGWEPDHPSRFILGPNAVLATL
jgi:hypothetical protein